jgi:hypothetical protein
MQIAARKRRALLCHLTGAVEAAFKKLSPWRLRFHHLRFQHPRRCGTACLFVVATTETLGDQEICDALAALDTADLPACEQE